MTPQFAFQHRCGAASCSRALNAGHCSVVPATSRIWVLSPQADSNLTRMEPVWRLLLHLVALVSESEWVRLIGWAGAWTWPWLRGSLGKRVWNFPFFLDGRKIPQTMERGPDSEWLTRMTYVYYVGISWFINFKYLMTSSAKTWRFNLFNLPPAPLLPT